MLIMRKQQKGFTLIELMIAVAILGVLGSVALVSYSNMVTTSQAQAMVANFESAAKTAKTNYAAARQRMTMGTTVTPVIPPDSAGWVALLNSEARLAPGGGPPYQVGTGSVTTGAVGIVFAGSYGGRDSTVTLHRPAFAGVPAGSVMVAQTNY